MVDDNFLKVIQILGKGRVKLGEPLAKHTTFKIGGPADLFYEAKTEEELIKVVRLSGKVGVPYFLLGGGSNTLFSDEGLRGIVIKVANTQYAIRNTRITSGAGVSLGKLVKIAAQSSLSGLEFAVGIPGTVGGAIRGNAGTATEWIDKTVDWVKILDKEGKIKILNFKDCQFGYRESRFKSSKEVILEAAFKLHRRSQKEIYKKMRNYLEKRACQPKLPSAGCVFKNPPSESAGRLIELCGLKGKQIGKAQISPLHSNFIVNLGGATCQDVLKLISLAKKEVKKRFKIELREEIKIVGELSF